MQTKYYYEPRKDQSVLPLTEDMLTRHFCLFDFVIFEEAFGSYIVRYDGQFKLLTLISYIGELFHYTLDLPTTTSYKDVTLQGVLDYYPDSEEINYIYFADTFKEALDILCKRN